MSNIVPSVGRKVWFYAGPWQYEPHDATVIKVHASADAAMPHSPVNLLVVDPDTGATRLETSVSVGDESTGWAHYRWMPYQQQVAKQSADIGQVGGGQTPVQPPRAEVYSQDGCVFNYCPHPEVCKGPDGCQGGGKVAP